MTTETTETIKFSVELDIEYRTRGERLKAIKEAQMFLLDGCVYAKGYSVSPIRATLVRTKENICKTNQ